MFRSISFVARLAASAALLLPLTARVATADDCPCREPSVMHKHCSSCGHTREGNHGLTHYPEASYWASGDAHVRSGALDRPGCCDSGSRYVAPSPWAYRSIAPYSHHYHSFCGDSYGECFDCRN